MCKHILIKNYTPNDLDLLADFCELSKNEQDGYGAIIRHTDNRIETLKAVSEAAFLLNLAPMLHDVRELVVHYRTSTNGQGIDYAHPFEHQGHYLTHNGVVSVPKNDYPTLTTNDSERLLHHFLDTGYNTDTIQGYFSCFILSEKLTQLIVDDTAPIYSDDTGRIYSSHDLSFKNEPHWKRIALSRYQWPIDGGETITPIQVSKKSNYSYGMDKASLSLGSSGRVYNWDTGYTELNEPSENERVELFFDCISPHEEEELLHPFRNEEDREEYIKELANMLGIELTTKDMQYINDAYSYTRY